MRAAGSQSQRRSGVLDRALYEAAEEGDLNAISKLLDGGAYVDAVIGGDGSPLIGAARQGQLEAASLLLDRGADPNMRVPGDGNPLIMAARDGHVRLVELLLERGANVDQLAPDAENALIQASRHGQLPVVRLLVARGADVNLRGWVPLDRDQTSGECRTPLSMAWRGKHVSVANFLGSVGARD
jgi:ankyrin repeat protein